MINSILVRNFQNHKKLKIDLDQHITVVIGPTDSGKSAILRSLHWVIFNRPSGDYFINHGSDFVSVSLSIDDKVIKRKKSPKGNIYKLDNRTFKAIGTKIPDEVSSLLNVSEVNFQSQHDDPWWFLKSPGEVSKELNSIINLSLIDSVFDNLSSEARKAKIAVDISEEKIKKTKQKIEDLEWVVEADRKLNEIEELKREIIEKREKKFRINNIIEEAVKIQIKLERTRRLEKLGLELVSSGKEIIKIKEKKKEIESILFELKIRKENIKNHKNKLRELESWMKENMSGICPVCNQPIEREYFYEKF